MRHRVLVHPKVVEGFVQKERVFTRQATDFVGGAFEGVPVGWVPINGVLLIEPPVTFGHVPSCSSNSSARS